METSQDKASQISALNDLIRINNDRITGYKKRMDISLDDDLGFLFLEFVYQSLQNIKELSEYIKLLGGKTADGNSLPGKYYHAWTDFKFMFSQQQRQIILDYCEYGEDVVKSAYKKAISDKEINWNKKIARVLTSHVDEFKIAHKQITSLRDNCINAA
jgi:uncharacterized protein (TIGR02284 family)